MILRTGVSHYCWQAAGTQRYGVISLIHLRNLTAEPFPAAQDLTVTNQPVLMRNLSFQCSNTCIHVELFGNTLEQVILGIKNAESIIYKSCF